MRPLDKRLVIVIGKGGVGKSTVAAALGLRAARLGRRTIVAEIGGRGDVRRMFGARAAGPAAGELELAPNLFTIAIDPQRALAQYLADQLPARALADLIGGSRTLNYLTAATPGLRELLCIGQVWELALPERRAGGRAEPYDLVILDAPATGHGIALLAAPRTFARAAQVGPIARQGGRIDATLIDAELTGVLGVCTPQEPAVNETLQTRARLAGELGMDAGGVVVNAVRPRRFVRRDVARLRAALADDGPEPAPTPGPGPASDPGPEPESGPAPEDPERELGPGPRLGPTGRRAVELALTEELRVRSERTEIRRLRRGLDEAPIELPFVYAEEIGPAELGRLGDRLWPGAA